MALEKLGVEKKELVEELQADYSRLVQKQHTLTKEAAPQRAAVANEIAQVKAKLDELGKND